VTVAPKSWIHARLADVCTKITDGTHHSPPNTASGAFKYVTAKNIRKTGLDLTDITFVSATTHKEIYARCPVEKGDVLYIKDGATTGLAVVNPLDEPFSMLSSVALLKPARQLLDEGYLKHWLNSPEGVSVMTGQMTGSAIRRLTLSTISSQQIPLPPLTEQRRIVAKLDSLTARTTRARSELDHIPRLVEKYKQAILAKAFSGELTKEWRKQQPKLQHATELVRGTAEPEQSRGGREATDTVKPGIAAISVNDPGTTPPKGWAWVPLRRIARQETGHTPSRSKPEYWDGGVPWIGIKDAGAHHGHVIKETLQTISKLGLENSSARLLPAGTVCLSRTASVGYVTVMGKRMATSQDFATWTCTEALDPKYLMYALIAEGEHIKEFGEGSTHTTIYFPEIRAFNICLAPKLEQAEIVRRIEAALAKVDLLASEHARASHLVPKLDQSILAKAFRGELVPQDPNDEPASVLLERIEAAAAGGAPRRTRLPKRTSGC
jgi:type I restriction enzyme S subunit